MLELLLKTFPDGIYEEDLISFTTPKGVRIKALELRTDDAVYLIKMDEDLQAKMDFFTGDFEGLDPYSDGYRNNNY